MITFLFWNLNNKPLAASVARLAAAHQVDVLVLAECAVPPTSLLPALDSGLAFLFSASRRLALYTRLPKERFSLYLDSSRFSVWRLAVPGTEDVLVTTAHLASKLHQEGDSQALQVVQFADTLRQIEREVGHERMLLVGDLNMNPFEPGVVGAGGLHAVMTRELATEGGRTVEARRYPFFYNPMWGLFGDGSPGPPGTYYYRGSEQVTYFWNIFDQVLLRPALLPIFPNGPRVLSTDGVVAFLGPRGLPSPAMSDHLPLLFQLAL